MFNRSLFAIGLAAAVALAAGCGSKQRQIGEIPGLDANAKPADLQLRSAEPHKVDQLDADAGTVDALTRKAQQYTQQLQPLVQRRAAVPEQAAVIPAEATSNPPPAASDRPAAPSGQPLSSKVEWMSPGQLPPVGSTVGGPVTQADGRGAMRAAVDVKDVPGPVPAPRTAPDPKSAVASIDIMQRSGVGPTAPTTDALATRLAQRIKDYPRDTSSHLEYQLLKFLQDEQVPQLAALSTLPPEDRELVTSVVDGLTNLRNALRADSNMLLSRKIKPILDSAERLRAQAELTIPTIALCKSVTGFGDYVPFEQARFPAGKENRAIVYCEVANFTSLLGDQQQWETQLKWDMTLYTEQGMSIWSDKTETIKDNSRNRRHDFFVRKIIALPPNLTINRYLLKVTIVDTQSNRVAEATTPIVIDAQ